MGRYGDAAILATGLFRAGKAETPRDAWQMAAAVAFPESGSSREKRCPMDAFLGLCEEGLVSGVPAGNYTHSVKNKRYAIEAVGLLRFGPSLADNALALWQRVAGDKAPNSQMDVVIGLWRAGVIES